MEHDHPRKNAVKFSPDLWLNQPPARRLTRRDFIWGSVVLATAGLGGLAYLSRTDQQPQPAQPPSPQAASAQAESAPAAAAKPAEAPHTSIYIPWFSKRGPATIPAGASLENAESIMGEDFVGPSASKTWGGILIKEREIPTILFSKEELERAKNLGYFLILRPNLHKRGFDPDQPTMLPSSLAPLVPNGNTLKAILKMPIDEKWALVSKNPVLPDHSISYLQETLALADYIKYVLRERMFGEKLPANYQDALDEFEFSRNFFGSYLYGNGAKDLTSLKINQLFRPTAIEALYDLSCYFLVRPNRIAGSISTNTPIDYSSIINSFVVNAQKPKDAIVEIGMINTKINILTGGHIQDLTVRTRPPGFGYEETSIFVSRKI